MNKIEIARLIRKHVEVRHGAAAFTVAIEFAKPKRASNARGVLNWSETEDIITEHEEEFLTWVKEIAPKKFEHLRPTPEEKSKEELLQIDKEIYAKKDLNPDQRKKLDVIKKLKAEIDASGEEGYPFFTVAKEYGMIIADSNAMVKTGILKRRRSTKNKKRFVYMWDAEEPDSKLLQKIELAAAKLVKINANNYTKRKRAEKLAQKEAKAREQLKNQIENLKPKQETFTHKSQGGAVLDPNAEWVNNWKAKNDGLTSEDLEKLSEEARNPTEQLEKPSVQEAQETIEPKKEDIPITVSVTTNGNKKTVSITIEI